MSRWQPALLMVLVLAMQLPASAKIRAIHKAKLTSKTSAVSQTAIKRATVTKAVTPSKESSANVVDEVRTEPAVLVPEGNDDFKAPAGALYTDSDDCG